jgi:Tol biopolymer transport system component/DNA-binding SARP family transcriptional activator
MLGAISLLSSDGADVDALLRQPKRLALLAYLSAPAPGTWHRRDMLIALFWPDLDTSHARTSLRNGLYVLRQTLGTEVLRTRGDEEISINPDHLATDLAVVWDALRNGRVDDALASFGGELLPGLFPQDSEGFSRWLDTERSRLRTALVVSANARIDQLEREGRLVDAIAIARRVIEIQQDDETAVRRMMSLCEANGDRAGALVVFESYRSRLAEDFDAEPAPETIALANRLRAASPPAPPREKQWSDASSAEEKPRGASDRAADRAADGATKVVAEFAADGSTAGSTASRSALVSGAGVPAVWWRRARLIFALAIVVVVGLATWRSMRAARPLVIGKSSPLTAEEGLQVEAAIAPNGRLVAYAKGNAHRLRIFVQRIGGEAAWPLTDDSTATQLVPRWAPDSDLLLFLSRNNAYVAPSLGGTPRLVARGAAGDAMVRSASWSPNGDSIAIVRNDSLLVQPLDGAGSRFVGRGRQLHSCVWAPSGAWIACVSGNWVAFEPGPLFGNEAPSAVLLFAASGGKPVEFAAPTFQQKSPAWSAAGDYLWLVSNRDGLPGEVYQARVGKDGRPAGASIRVGLTAEWISLSAKRIAYSVPQRRANIWSVPIPGEATLTLNDATRLTSGNHLIETVSAFPGSQWLVYDSNLRGNADIYRIRTDATGEERLTNDPRPEYTGTLSPDGAEIAWHLWVGGERHLFVKRLDSDSVHEVLPVPGDQGTPHWSPDGRSLAAWSHNTEAGAVFVVHRDERGQWMSTAWRLEGGQLPVWSVDGRALAYIRYDGGIETIPADSGSRTTIYVRTTDTDPIASQLVWNIDPATLWFLGSDPHGRGGIWSVPASGGRPRLRVRFDDASGRFHGPVVTSDGVRFYFTLDERLANVRWAELVAR